MYKFLVVDDEEIVRRGFRQKIRWSDFGFEFLEPCADGRQALDAIEHSHPDVVMTDICMPMIDGLEVAARIAKVYPEITVVVLSGYDDFEYARSALRSGVVDYVLKPITSRDLAALLSRLKEDLDAASLRRAKVSTPGIVEPKTVTRITEGFRTGGYRSFAASKVVEARDYIRRNYSNKLLSLEAMCRELSISPSYLSRILKRNLGKTFVDALTELRIEKAKELLTNPDLKTYAVADAVGYDDPRYFATVFKKATGVTPSEFRTAAVKRTSG